MSRIGKYPINIPSGVRVYKQGDVIKCEGKNGNSQIKFPKNELEVIIKDNIVHVTLKEKDNKARSKWGLFRTLINNTLQGVNQEFSKELEIKGVGYRAAMKGQDLKLNLGFSHEIIYKTPNDIKIETPANNRIIVKGIDKQKVGQTAAEIKQFRKPEPYKGKGIRYKGEYVVIKEGKKK